MLVLSVDTSSPRGTMALAEVAQEQIQIISEGHWQRDKSHSELITKTFEDLLVAAGKSAGDVQGVIVGVGPGSFTGVRVGINFARSLSFARDLPVWPVCSLRLWSAPLKEESVAVVAQAFRDLVYFAVYKRPTRGPVTAFVEPQALSSSKLLDHLPHGEMGLAGDGWKPLLDLWPEPLRRRVRNQFGGPLEARELFRIKVEDQLEAKSWRDLKPLYIRGSEAEEKLRQGLLRPVPRFT